MKDVTEPCATCGATTRDTRGRCRSCHARKARERWAQDLAGARASSRARRQRWRAQNPEKEAAASRRQRYGLDRQTFETLLAHQQGRCAICRSENATCVDHAHATGRLRAMLCRGCNAGLGLFREDIETLRSAAAYLLRTRSE